MKTKNDAPDDLSELRRRAEESIRRRTDPLLDSVPQNVQDLVQELQMHQVELEMQNEELRRARQELEDSQSQYADLYDYAPLGYFIFDRNGVICSANFAGAGMLGEAKNLIVGRPFSLFVSKDDTAIFFDHLRNVFAREVKQVQELQLTTKDGKTVEVQLQSVLSEAAGEGPARCRTAVFDITDRKRAEEEREKLIANLEYSIKELESFSYSVSHDLRAPLRAIDGFSAMLLKSAVAKLDQEERRKLDTIRQNTQKMDRLIEDLLTLSRLSRTGLSRTMIRHEGTG